MQIEDMPIGMLISRAARSHMEKIQRSLESYGVQKTQGPILRELSIKEGKTQAELAESMRITAPSMSVNLQKMETDGFLLRKTDEADMRQIRLYLTDKGKETAVKAGREIELTDKELVKSLNSSEKKELRRILIKIILSQSKDRQK